MSNYIYTDDSELIEKLRWRTYEELFKPYPNYSVLKQSVEMLCILTETKEEGEETEEYDD